MMINYITNQNLSNTSGGWSGIGANIYYQLLKQFDVNYIGPISPRENFVEKSISKGLRFLGLKGKFHFFSNKRLESINNRVNTKLINSAYNFFFGQTPWIKCESKVPYGTYMDAAFPTYLKIYSRSNKFSQKDILRIMKLEESWLQKAAHIFIGSQWAWDEMLQHYDLDVKQKTVIHTGGNIELPEKDVYSGGLNFVFISLNFEKKGGYVCVDAFKKIRSRYSDSMLTIIGERPPEKILKEKNVVYAGFLRKTVPSELQKFKEILSNAFMLIHPTAMDTMGAVLIEAGYFGCPSIAPKSFGIPELILNGKTGVVVDVPFCDQDFANAIASFIENLELYRKMRKECWDYTRTKLTWEAIGTKIIFNICNKI